MKPGSFCNGKELAETAAVTFVALRILFPLRSGKRQLGVAVSPGSGGFPRFTRPSVLSGGEVLEGTGAIGCEVDEGVRCWELDRVKDVWIGLSEVQQ